MSRIKFITDSAADIPAVLREEYGIQVMPFPIAAGDREYADGVDLTPQEFYDLLLSLPQIPTHAQLTPFFFEECFEQVWQEGYDHLIYTSINSKASATHSNAVQARDTFFEDHPEAKGKFQIHIIDSLCYTMGYGWAVLEGARMAKEGKDVQEICAFIQDWVDHVRVLFVPFDLKFAKKSGRVSAAAAFVGEALGLKPIMTFEDGASKVLSKVRGDKAVIPALLKLCQEEREEGTPYMLIRSGNPEQESLLAQTCAQQLDQPPAMEYYIGGVIAINAGPNLTGLVYRKK